MPILIEFLEDDASAHISASSDVPDLAWNIVRDAVLQFDRGASLQGRSVTTEWRYFLASASDLAEIKRRTLVAFEYTQAARAQLERFRLELDAVRSAAQSGPIVLSPAEIKERLPELGLSLRELRDYQLRDVAKMVSLAHGASFSVPGAGKTTVALAVSLLAAKPGTRLLVVAPKNAFGAWDEVIADCIPEGHQAASPFVRLSGSATLIREVLLSPIPPQRCIISYEQLTNSAPFVIAFLRQHPVHVILDESHRIKAGAGSQRGQTALALAAFAFRRDILSGTPIPNGISDIAPQMDFLWPGQSLGQRAEAAARPNDVLGPLYVRTTKAELDIGKVIKNYEQIEMTQAQIALYGIVRDELLKVQTGIRRRSNIDVDAASRSVMRLLQISSNPLLLVRKLTDNAPDRFLFDNEAVAAIFAKIFQEGDSPKIRRACDLALELAQQGERVVIWSTFTDTVERIAELLAPIGATFIHGQVPTGDASDPSTREGRIRMFHDPSGGCMALVANPAACSEGISLHHVCHHAIYVDRSYNAAHFLQSVDRIHRLGLKPGVETFVHVLESIAPSRLGSIDFSVRRRMVTKLRTMADALNDPDLHQLMLDEDEAAAPLDLDIRIEDILDVIEELKGEAAPPQTEEY